MERQLLERMVGAGVLIIALIIIVPAILDGEISRQPPTAGERPDPDAAERRTHTVRLNESAPAAPAVAAESPVPAPTPAPAPAAVTPAPAAAKAPPAEPPPEEPPDVLPRARAVPEAAPAAAQAPGAPLTPPGATDSQRRWAVQIGTFGQKDNAERLTSKLRGLGFAAELKPIERSGKTLYRVRVGAEAERADADALARRLSAAGHGGQIVPR